MAANAERASSASNDTPAPARQEPIEA